MCKWIFDIFKSQSKQFMVTLVLHLKVLTQKLKKCIKHNKNIFLNFYEELLVLNFK